MMAKLETQIFVGDLGENVDEQTLFNEFSKFGTIMQIKIMRHLVTKKSRGIAYIMFLTHEQAVEAKCAKNGELIMGARARVMFVGENKALTKDSIVLLSNLDVNISYNELKQACQAYGRVLYIKHNQDIRDPFTNRATVSFETTEQAKDCVTGMNCKMLQEKSVCAVLNDRDDKIIVVKADIEPSMTRVKEALGVVQIYQVILQSVRKCRLTELH